MPRMKRPVSTPDGEVARSVPVLHESRYSQSLEWGLEVLACFTPEQPVLGIAEIAGVLGISTSTTHRYVSTLGRLGYVVQGRRRKYRLTVAVTKLGLSALSGTSLGVHARPFLEELRVETGFSVFVGVLDGPEVLVVERVRGNRRGERLLDRGLQLGAQRPAYCTAIGKLLLASLPKRALREQLAEVSFKKRGPNSLANRRALRSELEQVRGVGLVVAEEEFAAGVYEIAAPLRSASEVVAGIGLEAHSSMISLGELVGALGPHLLAVAGRLSARLGYRRADERGGSRLAVASGGVLA
jgi:IclR family transcriptional regulator, pca regulon regulatory protein